MKEGRGTKGEGARVGGGGGGKQEENVLSFSGPHVQKVNDAVRFDLAPLIGPGKTNPKREKKI